MSTLKNKLRLRPVRIQMPSGPRLVTREMLWRVCAEFVRQLTIRWQVSGATGSEKTSDGLRLQVTPGLTESSGEPGPWDYEGWEPPEGDCGCDGDPILEVKKTVTCGRSTCCGQPLPSVGEEPPAGTAALITTTQECTLYDYTGEDLIASPCTRTIVADYDVGGDGTAKGPCPNVPSCGETNIETEGCEDAPLCSGLPNPGFKCYAIDEVDVVYAKQCLDANLMSAAVEGGVSVTDPDFTDDLETSMVGQTSFSAFAAVTTVSQASWVIRRRGKRKPCHLILGIDVDGDVFEEIISFDAITSMGSYTLTAPENGEATILSVTPVYGRLP